MGPLFAAAFIAAVLGLATAAVTAALEWLNRRGLEKFDAQTRSERPRWLRLLIGAPPIGPPEDLTRVFRGFWRWGLRVGLGGAALTALLMALSPFFT